MARGTLPPVSIYPFNAPNMEISIPAAIKAPPLPPKSSTAASEAGFLLATKASMGSTLSNAVLTSTYTTITIKSPVIMDLGRFFSGFLISPATFPTPI